MGIRDVDGVEVLAEAEVCDDAQSRATECEEQVQRLAGGFLAGERFTAHVGLVRLAMAGLGEVRIAAGQHTSSRTDHNCVCSMTWAENMRLRTSFRSLTSRQLRYSKGDYSSPKEL